MNTNEHEFFDLGTTDNTEQTESLADVGLGADDFEEIWYGVLLKIKMASVCSAVVIASRGAKDVMRKLVAMEKIFAK